VQALWGPPAWHAFGGNLQQLCKDEQVVLLGCFGDSFQGGMHRDNL
jgi:hypothetical protein